MNDSNELQQTEGDNKNRPTGGNIPSGWMPEAAMLPKQEAHRARVEEFRRRHFISLVTLVFTDLVGSTRLKYKYGDPKGVAIIQAHASLVRRILATFREAQEISTAGDSFFCVFVRQSEAVAFAVKLQAAMRAEFPGPSRDRKGAVDESNRNRAAGESARKEAVD